MKSIVVKLPGEKTLEVSPNQKIHDLISTLGIDSRVIAAKLDGMPGDLDRSLNKD